MFIILVLFTSIFSCKIFTLFVSWELYTVTHDLFNYTSLVFQILILLAARFHLVRCCTLIGFILARGQEQQLWFYILLFSLPASSTNCERCFSTCTNLICTVLTLRSGNVNWYWIYIIWKIENIKILSIMDFFYFTINV